MEIQEFSKYSRFTINNLGTKCIAPNPRTYTKTEGIFDRKTAQIRPDKIMTSNTWITNLKPRIGYIILASNLCDLLEASKYIFDENQNYRVICESLLSTIEITKSSNGQIKFSLYIYVPRSLNKSFNRFKSRAPFQNQNRPQNSNIQITSLNIKKTLSCPSWFELLLINKETSIMITLITKTNIKNIPTQTNMITNSRVWTRDSPLI